jgi:hypothetical protein
MRFTRRWRRILGWAVLLLWPAILPHPVNAVAACIWYPVLALAGLIYFLGRIQGDPAELQEPAPAGDSSPSASPTSTRLLVGAPSPSGQTWPEEPDSR